MISLDLILQLEGGYSNDENDPGGETMYGIIASEYKKYLEHKGLPSTSVRNITKEQVVEIYNTQYWAPMHLDLLAKDKAIYMFQFGINCGTRKAIMLVQEALGLKADGVIGPKSAAAINKAPMETLVNVQKSRYDVIIAHNEKLEVFRKGWNNRIKDTLLYIKQNKA